MDEAANNRSKRLGDYELLGRISDGAQASVYQAKRPQDNEISAIKVFKNTGYDDAAEGRFRREAEILRMMSHRNIVRYRDSFVAEGDWEERQNCLVMEFMDGETLKERLQRSPKGLNSREAKDVMDQILAGLVYAKEQHGVIHRDIKPSNIFILNDGQVRLFDFGIARMAGESTRTGGGACMGSFDYMAPDFASSESTTREAPAQSASSACAEEQEADPFRGDHISDIFSLTVVFYEMLTRQLPWPKFGERPELEYLSRWRTDKPRPPSHSPIAFRVVRHLTGFIDKGLSPDRAGRYQSFEEMREALRDLRPRILKHKGKDDYELLDGLDKGGFGEVYLARRARDGRTVAIKRLFTDRAPRRFLKEAEILRKYNHPNLVDYVDFFESVGSTGNKQLFLVMEYLEGMPGWSLRNRITDAGRGLDVVEVLQLFRRYLDALQYLHENVNQIIHRDIKPGNLYAPVGCPPKAKILDLGVARDVSGTQTHGTAPGTWDYMAPEFVTDNSRGTPQSDIYALGLSLFEALTGNTAFPRSSKTGQEAAADFVARATGIDKVNIDFSCEVFQRHPGIEQIVRRSIHRDPQHRYADAAEMRRAIMSVLREKGILGPKEVEETYDAAASTSRDAGVTGPATRGTAIDGQAEPVPEWQTWVAAEKSKRVIRMAIATLLTAVLITTAVWLIANRIAGLMAQPPAGSSVPRPASVVPGGTFAPVAAEPADNVSRLPEPVGQPEQAIRAAVEPMEPAPTEQVRPVPPAEPANAPPAKTVKPAEPAPPVVEPPLVIPRESVEPDSAEPDHAALLRDLLKDLRLLRIRSIAGTSYESFVDDAGARVDNARLMISQPEYTAIKDNAEVDKEKQRLCQHIAENAVSRYKSTRDGRFLAAARGALWSASPLYGDTGSQALYQEIIQRWNESSKTADLDKFIPLPKMDGFDAARESGGQPVRNTYLESLLRTAEFSQSVAVMLPAEVSVSLCAPIAKDPVREAIMAMALAPQAKTDLAAMPHPFYIAKTETTMGMMRCYRDNARAAVARDADLARYFTGRLDTQSLQQNANPYRLAGIAEAFEFCNWLSYSQGFHPVYAREPGTDNWTADFSAVGFRLPTETEWEYAARFGMDWYPAQGTAPWRKTREELDRNHPDDLVWFYYKTGPRSSMAEGRSPYPLGMFDMCGNVGELVMRHEKWQNKAKDMPDMSVCGGNFKDRIADKVMPWSKESYVAGADNVGFRVILPVETADFSK